MSIGQVVVLASAGLALLGGLLVFFRNRRALAYARRREMELRYTAERLAASESSRDTQEMEAPLVTPDIPTALVTSCVNGDTVLFAGTGLSASVGQPTWREALLGVLRRCQQERPDPVWNRLIAEVGEEQYDLVADLIIEKLGSAVFYSYLRDVLQLGFSPTASTVLREVQRLPFAGVISTLWDDLAVDTFSSHRPKVLGPGSPTADYSEVLRQDTFFVLNAYGSLGDNSLLVTADAFNEYLDSHAAYARFLGSIFATRTVFFVGAGVAGIEDLLRGVGVRSSDGRRHYALVPWSTEAELRRERLLRRYNVELLLYPANPQHSSVTEFLASLRRRVSAQRRINDGSRWRRAGAPLTHLTLENIGPFESLDLDFAEGWNVLLADNGCGKSTILRSIALALCGDEERAIRSGGRLLRAGASAGSIRVRFGEDSFETRLRRESSHVRVVPHNITPVQTGEWLVLGFPAIRGISASHSGPAAASPGRGPVVEDVLPLITSEVDTRLDDLTQWLLSSIYAGATESKISSLRRGGNRTVDRFFSVISQLGGGVELEFSGVDQETSEVLVTTPDGIVSMRSLSQGMNSVLTWTGCLISRLEEVERLGSKKDGHAGLLLVDEIDAHLHPSWQRRIIDAARMQFPDVQFVVTTHSPLVVGTMTDGNLWRLTREEDAVRSERFSARFRGWRADQILTSPLFETDIRDPDTERLLEEYAKLAVLDDLSDSEETDLRRVAERLKVRLPNPEQKEEARKARGLIQEASAAKLEQMPPGERDEVLEQLRIQVQEAIVGSRPER